MVKYQCDKNWINNHIKSQPARKYFAILSLKIYQINKIKNAMKNIPSSLKDLVTKIWPLILTPTISKKNHNNKHKFEMKHIFLFILLPLSNRLINLYIIFNYCEQCICQVKIPLYSNPKSVEFEVAVPASTGI